jgi:Protein of unknown function
VLTGELCVKVRIDASGCHPSCGSLTAHQSRHGIAMASGRQLHPRPWLLTLGSLALLAPASALAQSKQHTEPVPALYATQAEAEKAAKEHFQCTGAHRMGNQWMPCSKHSNQPKH